MDFSTLSPAMIGAAALVVLALLVALIVIVGLKRKASKTVSFEPKEEPKELTKEEKSGNYQAKSGFNFAPAAPKEPVLRGEATSATTAASASVAGAAAVAGAATAAAAQAAEKLTADVNAQLDAHAKAGKPADVLDTELDAPASAELGVEEQAQNDAAVHTRTEIVDARVAATAAQEAAADASEASDGLSDAVQTAEAAEDLRDNLVDTVGMTQADEDQALLDAAAEHEAQQAADADDAAVEDNSDPFAEPKQVDLATELPGAAEAEHEAAKAEAAEAEAARAEAAEAEAAKAEAAEAGAVDTAQHAADAPAHDAPEVSDAAAPTSAETAPEVASPVVSGQDAGDATHNEPHGVPAAAGDEDEPQAAAESEVQDVTPEDAAVEAALVADSVADAAHAARETTPRPTEDSAQQKAQTQPAVAAEGAAAQQDDIAPAEGRLGRLRGRLSRSQNVIGQGVLGILSAGDLDEDAWEEIEDTLLMADLGTNTTVAVVEALREKIAARGVSSEVEARAMLRETLIEACKPELDRSIKAIPFEGKPAVVLVVGVNGTGKTTTTGKLARVLVAMGHKVLLGAADTFRAAAADQLETWGRRVGAETVRGAEGADPASVAFDAVARGVDEGVDVVLVDTAGRLHTSVGLMDQLGKVKRVVEKKARVDEVLLVLDATIGQNGLMQARTFRDVVDITGVVLTKLDGSAKGGIVFQVQEELGVPVKLVGLGEGADDLAPFEVDSFVDALLGGASA